MIVRDWLIVTDRAIIVLAGKLPAVKRGRPYLGMEGKTLAATKPWEALGISRATWFNRRKAARAPK